MPCAHASRVLVLAIALSFSVPLSAESGSATSRPVVLLVNGGNEATTNYSAHEQELLAWDRYLFDNRGQWLNAGGKGTLVVPLDPRSGTIERDEAGVVRLEPGSVEKTAAPALPSRLRKHFQLLGQAPPPALTVVYGDHGQETGVALWGKQIVTAADLREWGRLLPPTVPLRSVHLHCYGAAPLAEDERVPPADAAAWPEYLETHYPANRCGVSLGGPEETVEYHHFEQSAEDSPWRTFFDAARPVSLQSLKDHFLQKEDWLSTPHLTSDLLIEDLLTLFCPAASADSPEKAPAPGKHESPAETPSSRITAGSWCHERTAIHSERAILLEDYREAEARIHEFERLKNEITRRILETHYPEELAGYRKYVAALELKQMALLKKPTAELRQRLAEAAATRTPPEEVVRFQALRMSIQRGFLRSEERENLFRGQEIRQWLKEHAKSLPLLTRWLEQEPYGSLGSLADALYQYRDRAQLNLRGKVIGAQQSARRFVEQKLEHPAYETLRRAYDRLRECETSPIH